MNQQAPCELLTWDTEFFAFPIARVESEALFPQTCPRIDAWCDCNNIRCLYFQARSDGGLTHRLAAANGFFVVDIRMTFKHEFERENAADAPGTPAGLVRLAQPQDLNALEELAAQSHRQTRFHLDGHFPPEKCDLMYARWIRRCSQDPASAVWVAQAEGQVIGYVTCEPQSTYRTDRIGLIAVRPSARGQGVGTLLVRAAKNWFADRRVDRLSVVTQGHNIPAQRLYQACGFVPSNVHVFYHKWYPGRCGPGHKPG